MKINTFIKKLMGEFEEDERNTYQDRSSTKTFQSHSTQDTYDTPESISQDSYPDLYQEAYPDQTQTDEFSIMEEPMDMKLGIDIELYEDTNHVYIKALMPGVSEEDIFIDITRDLVIIDGKRESQHIVEDEAYFSQELTWGEFRREISLPREVDIDHSSAKLEKGILFIKMKKTDRYRKKKLIPNHKNDPDSENENHTDSFSGNIKSYRKKYGKKK